MVIVQHAFDFATSKRCTRCGEAQPLTNFHKQASQPDGHKHYCKVCCNAINAAHYAAMPRTERQAYARVYYAQHKETIKASALRNYRADPERAKRRILAWNRTHGEQRRVYNLRTRRRNPEPHRERWRRRHARKLAVSVVPFTLADLEAKCAYWGNCCWICGGPREAIDHVKPLNKGGLHVLCNLRPICTACNTRKQDQWPYPTHRRF